MNRPITRYPLIDVLKAFAAQLIVLHHFSAYGPVSDALHNLLPRTMDALFAHGRLAVQVFLVVGGYLAARGLSSSTTAWRTPWVAVTKRYVRLLIPYLCALTLAMLCAAWVRPWLDSDLTPAPPTWAQWMAHAVMAQGVLDFEALSAGVWYIAMDFQLFAVFAALLWLGRGATKSTQLLVAVLCIGSMASFNRHAALDNWAVYFFGAYGLGVLAWWARRDALLHRTPLFARVVFVLTLASGATALVVDFRIRIALAMTVAIALVVWGVPARRNDAPFATGGAVSSLRIRVQRMTQHLSQHSYALFLVHFPMLLLANALFARCGFTASTASITAPVAALGFGIAGWAMSLWMATLFYRWVESPAAPWRAWRLPRLELTRKITAPAGFEPG